ncbi:hypothetical protein [Mycolicibacterium sp. XJ1904]
MSKYQTGSCVACGQGTDTAVAVRGEGEWHVAFLLQLGVPDDHASATVSVGTGCAPGQVPEGVYTTHVRVCTECFAKAPFHAKSPFHKPVKPALYVEGAELPLIEQLS